MSYSLESVYLVRNELIRLIMKAGTKKENKWFFTNSSFLPEEQIERIPNTWNNDNYVVVCDTKIVAYFEAIWNKVLNVVVSFRNLLLILDFSTRVFSLFVKSVVGTLVLIYFKKAEISKTVFVCQ